MAFYKKRKGANRAPSSKKYGLRQNQLFGPWGVGAILPCPDGSSIMIAGLDAFHPDEMLPVKDKRLAHYIGVQKLLAPPLGDTTVPAVRFPHWLYCPSCGSMRYCSNTQQQPPYCDNPECKPKPRLIPDRFIVVCPNGHIDDLPIIEWVHHGKVPNPSEHHMVRYTAGGDASLGDIWYRCKECGVKRSLWGITHPGALEDCGYHCHGSSPWLDKKESECAAPPNSAMVVQRGGTNVWYSDVVSSIYIPDSISKDLSDFVEDHIAELSEASATGSSTLDLIVGVLSKSSNYSAEQIKAAFSDAQSLGSDAVASEGDYREAEFATLKHAAQSSQEPGAFVGQLKPVISYSSSRIKRIVESVTLVSTLKETKALVGFTRLNPDENDEKTFKERRLALSNARLNWTLGIQQTGEGIFLALSKTALDEWAERPEANERIHAMQANFDRANLDRNRELRTLNPHYLLIHTLSHLLMLGLAKECGYTAASIKERIYCDKFVSKDDTHENMLGLLIYTASDDSEGSLGGLVRAGSPGRFDRIFDRAIEDASWCSCDPVCIESPGQGQSSCNLAACYSCALVPETSCECGNKFLDRACVVGTMNDKSVGILGQDL